MAIVIIGDWFHKQGNRQKVKYVKVRCDCGKEFDIQWGDRNRQKCCISCRSKTHGQRQTPTYAVWSSMKARCSRTTNKDYSRYGGRGITVCERWMEFENFLADMGEKPSRLTIDRIDNDRGYEPGNCRWATMKEQCSNRSVRNDATVLTVDGVSKTLLEWHRDLALDIHETTIRWRLSRGWTHEESLFGKKKNRNETNNSSFSSD